MDGSFRMLEHLGERHEEMLRFPLSHCLLLAVLLGLPAVAAGSPPSVPALEFNRDIRPILSENRNAGGRDVFMLGCPWPWLRGSKLTRR